MKSAIGRPWSLIPPGQRFEGVEHSPNGAGTTLAIERFPYGTGHDPELPSSSISRRSRPPRCTGPMASSIQRFLVAGALALALSSPAVAQPGAAGPLPTLSADALAVRHFLDAHGTPPGSGRDSRANTLWQVVRAFYEKRACQPAWLRGGTLSPQGRRVLQLLAAAPREGLDSSRYALPLTVSTNALRASASGGETPTLSARDLGGLEVSMSYALLRLAADLTQGQVDPRGSLILWVHTPRTLDPTVVLEA